jgi:FkbM family methyltransferase
MTWKRLKGRLFLIAGPNAYRAIHALYFFLRMVFALLASGFGMPRFGDRFFGRDLNAFAARLKPGDQVLDIGAFLGGSTVLFARAVRVTGKVTAFEPVHHRLLRRILRPFRLRQVTMEPLALAAENGSTELVIPIHNGVPLYSQSGFSESYTALSAGSGYTFLKFPTALMRLDDYLAAKGIRPESLAAVKIDVEGSEMGVFAGGEDFFRRFRGFLMCEFWFDRMPPLGWEWLRARGYSCRYLDRQGRWVAADTAEELAAICRGETYGNFFWEKS